MGIARFAAPALLLVLTDCGREGAEPPPEPSSTTTTEPQLAVSAQRGCGGGDGPTIEVEVQGAGPSGLRSELVIDGEVVTTSDETNAEDAGLPLTLSVPFVPDMFDPLTVMSTEGGVVRVR